MNEKININISKSPRIIRIELNRKEGKTINASQKNTVEIGAAFSSIAQENLITLLLKEDLKFRYFDLLLETKTDFKVQPFPEQKIEENKKLQTQLIDRVLPFISEIIAYLTSKMGYTPLILPPILSEEFIPIKEKNKE